MATTSLVVAGCGIGGILGPQQDDLSTWQRAPLPADPNLAQAAAQAGVCRIDVADGAPLDILIQDRRTQSTAAFLVRGPATVGSCMYSSTGGGGGGSSQPARQLPQLMFALAVDEDGSGGIAAATATLVGGRAAPGIDAVQVEVGSELVVEASVEGGYWLAWWPGEMRATRVVGLAAGNRIVELVSGPAGWTPS